MLRVLWPLWEWFDGCGIAIQIAKVFGSMGVSFSLIALSIGMLISFASGSIHADKANRVRAIVVSDLARSMANVAIIFGLLSGHSIGLFIVVLGGD